MSDAEFALRLVQTALSIFGAAYLLCSFGAPVFFLRHFSLSEMSERKSQTWRLWVQGTLTVLAVGVLVWSAAYALIAVIPYDWGNHDEDGEWQAARDTIRILITFVGAPYISFSIHKVAHALALQKFIRSLVRSDRPEGEIEAAMRILHRDLTGDHYRQSYWESAEEKEFSAAVLKVFDQTISAYGKGRSNRHG